MDSKTAISQLNKIKKYNTKNIRLAGECWCEDWKTLISIMMSAQTRDSTTINVCNNLFEKYNSVAKIAKANISNIEKIISSVNYFKTKAKHISETAKIISEKGIPKTIEELIELPGVGRKTANVFISETGIGDGIGVDTHVFRISKKLKWANGKTPQIVEFELKKLFPKKYWNIINTTLVKFGQTHTVKEENEILSKII